MYTDLKKKQSNQGIQIYRSYVIIKKIYYINNQNINT